MEAAASGARVLAPGVSRAPPRSPRPFPRTPADPAPHQANPSAPDTASTPAIASAPAPKAQAPAPARALRPSQPTPTAQNTSTASSWREAGTAPAKGTAGTQSSPRHAKNRARQNGNREPRPTGADNKSEKEDPLRVIVTGFPQYSQPQDLTRVFAKFGSVKLDKITNKFATLSYTDDESAKAAIQASQKVNVYGEFLNVCAYSEARFTDVAGRQAGPKRDFSRSKQKGTLIDPHLLDFSGSFTQQLERLLARVRLTQEDVAALTTLYTDIEVALQQQWPGCTAIPFGSITTGLGVRSSDADCFIHVPPQFRHPHANFVNKAKRVLQQYPDVFAEILSIPRANTPIVKLFHVPTLTNADLTFKTPLGAQNSKLIAFLLHSDPRLLPMAVTIKYWAKVHDFSGTGRLTNYTLTLLIIFYLQQPPMSILPSVEWLQRDRNDELMVDFWNTGFMSKKENLPPSSNTSSISEILGGFFEYYSMFNFEEMAVCPFLGTPVKKDAFHDLNQLPKEFNRYKGNVLGHVTLPMRSNTAICVQDPFEQCHNVASCINGKLAAEIKAFLKFAANAYEKEKLAHCEHFLDTILLERPKIIRVKGHPEYRVNLFPRIIVTIIEPDWKPVVRDLVFSIFEDILKIKLGKVEEKLNLDTKKEKEKYMGTLTKAIWKRKQFSRLYSVVNAPFFDKQARITEEIIKADKEEVSVSFQLTLTFCAEPPSAVLGVRLAAGDLQAFRDFGKFFISVMQAWFMTLLRPYARAPELDTAGKIARDRPDPPAPPPARGGTDAPPPARGGTDAPPPALGGTDTSHNSSTGSLGCIGSPAVTDASAVPASSEAAPTPAAAPPPSSVSAVAPPPSSVSAVAPPTSSVSAAAPPPLSAD